MNYFKNHWQGKLSLGKSFWINFVLITVALWCLSAYVDSLMNTYHDKLTIYRCFTSLLTIWGLIYIWQFIGCWRSALNSKKQSLTSVHGTMVQLILIGSLCSVIPVLFLYKDMYGISTRTDGLSEYTLSVEDGEIILDGAFAFGLEKDLKKILEEHDDIYLINLNSIGGRVGVAKEVAKLIAEYELITYSDLGCDSACVIAFVAGKYRILNEEGQLGFHSSQLPGLTKEELADMDKDCKSYYKSRGASDAFIEKAFNIPPDDMWFPTVKELAGNNIITHQLQDGKIVAVQSPR